MDWKIWLPIIIAAIGSLYQVLSYYQAKRATGQGAVDMRRPHAVAAIFMILAWGAVAFDYYDRHYRKPVVEPYSRILAQWGNDGKTSCWGTVRTSEIVSFSEQYKVALICGLNDPTIDLLDEKRISVSASFRIVPDQVPIVMPMREEMAKAIVANIESSIWYMPILIPEGVDTAAIRQMSDVKQYGGELLSPQYSKRER